MVWLHHMVSQSSLFSGSTLLSGDKNEKEQSVLEALRRHHTAAVRLELIQTG